MNSNYSYDEYDEPEIDEEKRTLPLGFWIGLALLMTPMMFFSFILGRFTA